MKSKTECCNCYPREHGKNGEVRREWSSEWMMFLPLCRKHSIYDNKCTDNQSNNDSMPTLLGLD